MTVKERLEEFHRYLDDNLIQYTCPTPYTVEIDGKVYELYRPTDEGDIFDDSFGFTGLPVDPDHKGTKEPMGDCYAYKFGGMWYWLPKGDENNVKLRRLKYLGKAHQNLFDGQGVYLGVHGQYEILSGSGTYADWCSKAKFLNYSTLGICELNTLAGALKFQQECQKNGLKPVIGMECTVFDETNGYKFTVKVFVRNQQGWYDILTINKFINCDNPKYISLKDFNTVTRGNDNLVLILDPKTLDYDRLAQMRIDTVLFQLDPVEYTDNERDRVYLENLKKFFTSKMLPVTMTDAWYLDPEYSSIRQRLNSIGGTQSYDSDDQYMKGDDDVFYELQKLIPEEDNFAEYFYDVYSEARQRLIDITEGIDFTIDVSHRHLPRYVMTPEESQKYTDNEDMFWGLIADGLERHPDLIETWGEDVVMERINREVDTIKYGDTIDYFLITRDIINWAHENGIMTGISRGSAGGCLISYLLGITKLDPLKYNLLFERFLNKGRVQKSLPDIDCDFSGNFRDKVKKYMEERFGFGQVASVGTYSALQLRAAIKDMSRLYGLQFQEVNEMMKLFSVDDRKPEDLFYKACASPTVKDFVKKHPDLVNEVMLVMPAPKAQSIHACATMIFSTEHDMFRWVPIRKVGNDYVTEWEGTEMDSAGFLKQDILGIKQLDKFQEMVRLIKENEGVDIDIFSVPLDDPEVYRYFQEGWTEDNFHFGSRGLTGYCQKMKPENIEDLIAAISLYRPGAMENGFHEDYIKRKNGNDDEPIQYWVGAEEILKSTYGVIVYQESVMELCRTLGGLSMVEADDVRKAMVKKKYEALAQYHERFTPYYMENFGVTKEYAEMVWDAIDKASSYLFNRCISGKERIKRHSRTNDAWHPTISEMYRIKHDKAWAVSTGHKALHSKYVHRGYGKAWSMNENGDLVLNEIVDIRYQGIRETLTIHLESGKTITITGNHKFPTPNGEVLAENLKVGDFLYVYDRNVNDWVGGSFTDKNGFNPYTKDSVVEHYELNSEKGHEGFTMKGETNWKKWDKYRSSLKKDYCEVCGKVHRRLECHHIDGDHANNELENLITVCPSCHKKFHYKMDRITMGRKGIKTRLDKIVSITYNEPEEVYDVEMEDPYHTFTTQQGVVTCNSHAAAYAITGYISQWLKVHYPIEYWSVAFHYAQEGDSPRYIAEINKTGVCQVKPVDINISSMGVVIDFQRKALYWSLMGVKQVAERAAEQILSERKENGQYWSLTDFITRHKWKGSAINSRVIKNLILSGAFDEIEGIEEPYGRVELLVKYLSETKSKIDPDDPVLKGCDNFRNTSVWWSLMQKQVSGLAFFDYQDIFRRYIPKDTFDSYWYKEVRECLEMEQPSGYVTIGGYLTDIDVKTTKNKSQMAKITLENNYDFIEVIVFNDSWLTYQQDFLQSKGSLVFVSGQLDYDSRSGNTVLKMNKDSIVKTITL